jgi:hypothetical protein
VSEDPTLWKDSLQRFVFVESGCRPLIGVDAWRPIYNSGYRALQEKRVNEGERTPEGQRARVHQNHPFVEDRCQQFFHSGR